MFAIFLALKTVLKIMRFLVLSTISSSWCNLENKLKKQRFLMMWRRASWLSDSASHSSIWTLSKYKSITRFFEKQWLLFDKQSIHSNISCFFPSNAIWKARCFLFDILGPHFSTSGKPWALRPFSKFLSLQNKFRTNWFLVKNQISSPVSGMIADF